MAQNRPGGNQPSNKNVTYSSTPVTTNTVVTREDTVPSRPVDLVRWGPVIAGLLAALSTLAVLSVLGLAIGLGNYDPGDRLSNFGLGAGIWAGISALLSFLVGGWMAARTAGVRGRNNGILNGAMVWFLAIPMLLYLLGSGVSALVGTATNVAGNVVQAGGQAMSNPTTAATIQAGAQGAGATAQAVATNVNVTPQDVKSATNTASSTAWGTLLSLGLSAAAALAGGALGARPEEEATTHVSVSRTT